MAKPSKLELIRKFHEDVEQRRLTNKTKVVYRVSGGMPSERIEKEYSFSGNGKADVMVKDSLKAIPSQKISSKVDQAEIYELFHKIQSGIDSLVPRSEARFLPDSVVGSITIEVKGEDVTLYFLADEEERAAQDKPVAPKIVEATRQVMEISDRLLKAGRRKKK